MELRPRNETGIRGLTGIRDETKPGVGVVLAAEVGVIMMLLLFLLWVIVVELGVVFFINSWCSSRVCDILGALFIVAVSSLALLAVSLSLLAVSAIALLTVSLAFRTVSSFALFTCGAPRWM